ncbi:hypothetical protein TRVL_04705 [Trypanosoma vivax]|nr:hypothetical protein TRVL_04705 [Trypanosoma vivax]
MQLRVTNSTCLPPTLIAFCWLGRHAPCSPFPSSRAYPRRPYTKFAAPHVCATQPHRNTCAISLSTQFFGSPISPSLFSSVSAVPPRPFSQDCVYVPPSPAWPPTTKSTSPLPPTSIESPTPLFHSLVGFPFPSVLARLPARAGAPHASLTISAYALFAAHLRLFLPLLLIMLISFAHVCHCGSIRAPMVFTARSFPILSPFRFRTAHASQLHAPRAMEYALVYFSRRPTPKACVRRGLHTSVFLGQSNRRWTSEKGPHAAF